jgi:hypothetical protein
VVTDRQPRVRFITALVADDIRREATGKEILIGVYTAKIIVASVGPGNGVILSISIVFEMPDIGDIPIEIEIRSPSDDVTRMRVVLNVTETSVPTQINAVSMAAIPIPLFTEGAIIIRVRQYDGEWETIRTIPVIVNPEDARLRAGTPSASAIVLEQPSSQSQPASSVSSSPPEPSRPARPTRRRRS